MTYRGFLGFSLLISVPPLWFTACGAGSSTAAKVNAPAGQTATSSPSALTSAVRTNQAAALSSDPPTQGPATDSGAAVTPPSPCSLQCVGTGGATRLVLEGGRTYRFVMFDKTADPPQEFHVLSEVQDNNIMLVERAAIGDAFTVANDKLRVCSKLRGTGGGCSWSCAVDATAMRVKLFTDQLSATLSYSCR